MYEMYWRGYLACEGDMSWRAVLHISWPISAIIFKLRSLISHAVIMHSLTHRRKPIQRATRSCNIKRQFILLPACMTFLVIPNLFKGVSNQQSMS